VTLKIEVNSEGQVTRAEIVKSAGSGFDEEALKAVKQSRFEPGSKRWEKRSSGVYLRLSLPTDKVRIDHKPARRRTPLSRAINAALWETRRD
jgi:TonB family protein